MSDVIVTVEINGIKKELRQSDVIACKSEEEAQALFKALKYSGFTWCNGDDLFGNTSYINNEGEKGRGYCIDKNGLSHSRISWFKSKFDYENGDKSYNVMYFDELFTPQVTVDELWEVIKRVSLMPEDYKHAMTSEELEECFNYDNFDDVILNNTPQSLVSKYNAWNESKVKIEVGDIFEDSYSSNKFIVISEKDSDRDYEILDDCYDKLYMNESIFEDYKKVGHKDITNLFTP